MGTRYLIVADPLKSLLPEFDLGVCLSREILARGIEVDYLDLLASNRHQTSDDYLAALPVRPILEVPEGEAEFWELGDQRSAPVEDYKVILQRKDPPVDKVFVEYHRHFEAAPEDIVQINRPPMSYVMCEHTAALDFPEYAAPTTVCQSLDELSTGGGAHEGVVVW
jgi:glutathione synthase